MTTERKPIPPLACDTLMRMHMKSMTAISDYMARGCGSGGLNGPRMVCVELINLRGYIDKTLEQYSK